ncbi:MAG: hypothetical protein JXP37_10805 [Coriobacteriia bacterium]|nr:hypothetical protein [Coriobacteriia bacterium]
MGLKAVRTRTRLEPPVRRRLSLVVAVVSIVAVLLVFAAGVVVQASIGCAACHAMQPYAAAHAEGPHASEACATCHVSDSVFALGAEGLRAVGWGVAAIGGRSPGITMASEAPCRACHDETLSTTVISRGISVRHADFLAQPCADCHSGTAHLVSERHYRPLEMDDCMGCHKAAADDPASCELCHVGDAERREGDTSWRSTHGAGWETTHGMGDITTCSDCHAPRFCIECHGVRIPHPTDWVVSHGATAVGAAGPKCETCHTATWCSDCHGLEMPHPEGFLPEHGPVTLEVGQGTCDTCHASTSCDVCHFASSHPVVPGVGMGHGW